MYASVQKQFLGGAEEKSMPQNGDISKEFGVFKTVCCGAEIVISKGASFPDCPVHPRLMTEWKPVVDLTFRHVSEFFPNTKKKDSAA